MKTNYFKMAFVSLFAVAALLCSCDKDEDENSNDDNGGSSVLQNNTLTVSVENGASYSGIIDIVKVETDDVPLVSVPYNNGVFTLNLPASLDDQYISIEEDEVPAGVTVSDPNVKVSAAVDLYAYKSDFKTGYIYHGIGDWQGVLIYVDRNLSITGSYTETYGEVTETGKYNCNMQKGWNIRYEKETQKAVNLYEYEATTQVPAGAKWYFQNYYSSSESGSLRTQAPLRLSAKRKFGFIK
jgi:hypothetical protein